jgi:hypothetical protein
MKLPVNLSNIFPQKSKPVEIFLSLLLDSDHVAAASWFLGAKGEAELLHAVARKIIHDSWEERIKAADQLIVTLEERANTENIHKMIFGLPVSYLDADGNILPSIKPELKKFSHELELKAIGFVPIHQAIVYKYEKEDGIPLSALLINDCKSEISVTLYKIGRLVGSQIIPHNGEIIAGVERALQSFKDVEVLPPRMLLYGADTDDLEQIKSDLTRHPWTNRANFLHFPKIETLPLNIPVVSVSLAGASELAASFQAAGSMTDLNSESAREGLATEDIIDSKSKSNIDLAEETEDKISANEDNNEEVIAAKIEADVEADNIHTEKAEFSDKEESNELMDEADDEAEDDESDEADDEDESDDEDAEVGSEEIVGGSKMTEESNVRMVAPEEFGFTPKEDILASSKLVINKPVDIGKKPENGVLPGSKFSQRSIKVNKSLLPLTFINGLGSQIGLVLSRIKFNGGIVLPVGIGVLVIIGIIIYWLGTSVLPTASVTLDVKAETLQASASAVIDATVKEVDPSTKTIPGYKLEKSVSDDKTIQVTGKKQVGEAAKGDVTIYNKSTEGSRTFKKGSQLSSGNFKFTLDGDVTIASASENISEGSITYGKGKASITAAAIGTSSNLPSGSEFSLKDYSSDEAIARNEANLSGGTSRSVTVVTRADYDALVTDVTQSLLDKAKTDLASGVSGGQKLIDDTVKTSVSDKKFDQEIDQEATQLHGTITLNVSGIAYDEKDIQSLLEKIITPNIPAGYTKVSGKSEINITKTQIKKNGSITIEASLSTQVKPDLQSETLAQKIAGKSDAEATDILAKMPGVITSSFQHHFNLFNKKIPNSIKNITVKIEVKN